MSPRFATATLRTRTRGLGLPMAVALSLIAIAMAGMFATVVVTVRSLDATSRAQRSTSQMTADALGLERLMVDLETGVRGYMLTDDARFLEPYRTARTQLGVVESTETNILDEVPDGDAGEGGGEGASEVGERDPQFKEAAIMCVQNQGGSTSLLQRHLRIGYGRAAAILDAMVRDGYIGEMDGASRARPVLQKAYEDVQDIIEMENEQ